MVATDARTRPVKLRRDWRYRFVTARDRLLIELGIENHALTVYDGWRSTHERVVQGLARRTHSNNGAQSAIRFSLGLLPFARTRKLYNASSRAFRALDAFERNALPELLTAMVEFEKIARAAPISAGRKIRELLSSDEGRKELATASEQALRDNPDSPFLIYLRSVSLAKSGSLREAHDLVTDAIRRCQDATASGVLTERIGRRYRQLESAWRVVDIISRDDATWSDGSTETPAWAKSDEAPQSEAPNTGEDVGGPALIFSEQLIQGRQHDRYLESCKQNFDSARGLFEKFRAIKAMLREARRPIVSYRPAYDLAHACFEEIRSQWENQSAFSYIDSRNNLAAMRATARFLADALRIARQLRLSDDVAKLESCLLYLAGRPNAGTALWVACGALVDSMSDIYIEATIALVAKSKIDPQGEFDIREFFIWARKAQRYDLAHALYERLPQRLKFSQAVLQYSAILQQEGQFARGAELVQGIHENSLRQPASLDANFSWTQIRRAGELAFAAETAEHFASIPQPTAPRGVIFLAPRNIAQMRQYPLVVLMEMRRRGWAVISLVKGALPLEPTGVSAIDRFLGCVTMEGRFSRESAQSFPAITGFDADIERGRLRWNELDLDHILWEEAITNRRRYHADYSCPALKPFLERLIRWTKIHGVLLEDIRRTAVADGIACGFLVLQQARLPESIVRFYLEEFGDPDSFFCLHSTNGYENYFANFSAPVSTRIALRNMTRHPETRSASFPVPEAFEAFYQQRRARSADILRTVQDITRTRRSTHGQEKRLPEAEACEDRIIEWREKGGKVACLFGKVVCDSCVPIDGGPSHKSMKDWLNHAIDSVRNSGTLLLIKPHPHEIRNEIGLFMTEYFFDLIEKELPDNVILLGHRWFDIHDLEGLIDLGVIYSGTSSVELGVLGIPCVISGRYAPIDYPIGHAVPRDRQQFREMLRFEQDVVVAPDLKERSAAWLAFMSEDGVAHAYRYHARQITNKRVFPPWWFADDISRYRSQGDLNIELLADAIAPDSRDRTILEAAQ